MDDLAWQILEGRSKTSAAKDFIRFHGGKLTYADLTHRACEHAGRYVTLGVRSGDIVPTLLSDVGTSVATWFGLMRMGATWAPINTEFRGEQLVHALNLMEARLLIASRVYLDSVLELLPSLAHLRQIVVVDSDPPASRHNVQIRRWESIDTSAVPAIAAISRSDVAMIQFTSGSTGISKAVQLSHGYLVGQARLASRNFDMRPDDVIYCPFPLYHWDATIGSVMGALVTGATAALATRFSASRFWDDIRTFDATMFDFMGATLSFLQSRPASERDRQHRVRLAWGLPMPDFRLDFEKRFGFPLIEGYGSTEGGVCVFQKIGERYPQGSCGKVAPEFELRLVGEGGIDVPTGDVGEIVTRPHDRTLMMNGYLGMPQANAAVFRDGWYHSGDLGRLDAEGNLYFVGRCKDIIRRRGENISAYEIEREIENHPDVLEAAAFGVPSPVTEEDVAVAVVLRSGAALSREALREYCSGRMARYMIPEHVLFLETLPRTPSEKVAKAQLKKRFADPHRPAGR
jgi:crotonobetaine/carnitine-CoA ligase